MGVKSMAQGSVSRGVLWTTLLGAGIAVVVFWSVTTKRAGQEEVPAPEAVTQEQLTVERSEVPPIVPEEWKGRHGRFHIGDWREVSFEEQQSLTPEQEAEIERLRSIGYLSGKEPVPLQSGVTVYNRDRTYDGLNFYTTGDVPGAVLMDMEGRILHKWAYSYLDAWVGSPNRPQLRPSPKGSGFWRRAHLFRNGDVLAVFDGLAIMKVDRYSNLLWVSFGGFHHDLHVMPDGRIYVLTREAHIVPWYNPDDPVLEDFVAVLDSDGRELERVSVLEAIAESEFASVLDDAEPKGDLLHSNTVEVLDGRLEDRLPAFRDGNVLVTVRELDLVIVINMETALVEWALQDG
ncbi:MAG: hypothetical protein GF405_01535, partial [Candidatus Eisenbacteria bacterium]|nr:hypothetical protein [Candidatus Eisenbacteria bacterium]